MLTLTALLLINLTGLISKPFHLFNNDIEYQFSQNRTGDYRFRFNTQFTRPEDDMGREEVGRVEEGVLRVNGSYHYQPKCDERYQVTYSADENGFMAKIIRYSNKQYQRVNGTLVLVGSVCSTMGRPAISSNCIASLQGGCSIG